MTERKLFVGGNITLCSLSNDLITTVYLNPLSTVVHYGIQYLTQQSTFRSFRHDSLESIGYRSKLDSLQENTTCSTLYHCPAFSVSVSKGIYFSFLWIATAYANCNYPAHFLFHTCCYSF